MKRRHIYALVLCTVCSTLVLFALLAFSGLNKEMKRLNFNRRFAGGNLEKVGELDMGVNSYYFSGKSKSHIYLGNRTAPFHAISLSNDLKDSTHVNVTITLDSVKGIRVFRMSIDSPYFYLSHGEMPVILKGDLVTKVGAPFMKDSDYYFVEAVPFRGTSFAMRSYSLLTKGYELAKKTLDSLSFRNDLLMADGDGTFSVDGKLLFDKETNDVIYMHYYKNEILVSDTSLNLRYRFHTIDSFRHPHIGVTQVSDDQTMMSAPPLMVNMQATVDSSRLFIVSNLIGENEDMEAFLTHTVVDLYDVAQGKYKYSFYLPSIGKVKANEIMVSEKFIFAMYGRILVVYDLNGLSTTAM